MRFAVWASVVAIIGVDAGIATPLGLTWLYFAPLALAAFYFRRAEVVALGLLCAASSLLFGPLGDPLGVHAVTLEVSPLVQRVASLITAVLSFVGLGVLLSNVVHQHRVIGGLRQASQSDPLTGLANRRALEAFMAQHAEAPGAVLVVDLDHFKRVNDEHGHGAGDAVLVELARRLERVTRSTDLVARTGGEEFVLVLPGASDSVGLRVGRDICDVVRSAPFPIDSGELAVTASVGVAAGPIGGALVERADQAVYASKSDGRDRVTLAAT